MDDRLEDRILTLLARRRPGATICPSEVAREVAGRDWRPLMPAVREAAARLAADGRVRVTRRGVEVDAREPGGPIRIGRPAG